MKFKNSKELPERSMPFNLNHVYKLKISSEFTELSDATREKILKSVVTIIALRKGVSPLSMCSLLEDIEWQWKTSRGTLNKRIGKWLKDNEGIDIPEELSTAIGNIVRESLVKDQVYYFDFVKDFGWEAGAFGDDESCFYSNGHFNDRKHVLPNMQADARFFAIRFFKKYKQKVIPVIDGGNKFYSDEQNYYRGIGRMWLCHDHFKRKGFNDSPIFVAFNGYGLTTVQATSIFASFTGLSTDRIGLTNNKKPDGNLYNNEGGMVCGDPTITSCIQNYDFGLCTDSEKPKSAKPIIDTDNKLKDVQVIRSGFSIKKTDVYKKKVKAYYTSISKRVLTPADARREAFNRFNDDMEYTLTTGLMQYMRAEEPLRPEA